MVDDPEEYNAYNFWRVPPPSLDVLEPLNAREQVDEHRVPRAEVTHSDELLDHETEDSPMEDEENPISELLAGSAGTALLGLLGQLSQHLGTSRFSRVAGILQEDILRLREQSQEISLQARRFSPPEDSTLNTPGVMESMGSMLRVMDTGVLGGTGAEPRLEPMTVPLFVEDADASVGLNTPASPEGLMQLSPPRWADLGSGALGCPICLDPINVPSAFSLDGEGAKPEIDFNGEEAAVADDPDGAVQMPCAKQHVFHRRCLLRWLESTNSCPVCRHKLPAEEAPSPGQRVQVPMLPLPSEAPADLEALPADAEPADDLEELGPDRREEAMAVLDDVIAQAVPRPNPTA